MTVQIGVILRSYRMHRIPIFRTEPARRCPAIAQQ